MADGRFARVIGLLAASAVWTCCTGSSRRAYDDPARDMGPPGERDIPTLLPVAPVPAGETLAGQAQRGAQVFAAHCTRCHGDAGRGSLLGPPLIGPATLRTEPSPRRKIRTRRFETAANVGGFIAARMPPTGLRLPSADAWAAAAFLLRENGIATDGPALDPETGKAIPIQR